MGKFVRIWLKHLTFYCASNQNQPLILAATVDTAIPMSLLTAEVLTIDGTTAYVSIKITRLQKHGVKLSLLVKNTIKKDCWRTEEEQKHSFFQ